jgi:glycosidase
MVELVPPAFFKWLIAKIKTVYPDLIFVAEVYKKDLYGEYIRNVGFDYLYDKSGLYDTLRTIVEKNASDDGMPVELWQSTTGITRNWQFLGDLQPYMLNFLENHDEQRFASDFFGKKAEDTMAALSISLLLNTAPFMIYFGEEAGERGMDAEGFSGIDGRTTIFDYWGVKSLQAWANHGKFDGAGLDEEQQTLRAFYRQLLRIARSEKAITQGDMYDLTYAQGEGFNKHEQYAFIRKYKKQTLLVVLNFYDRQVDTQVRIPQDAFEYLKLEEESLAKAEDLLTGTEYTFPLHPHTPICLTIPAWKGVILKIKG